VVWNLIRGGTEGQCARAVLALAAQQVDGRVAVFRREGYFLDTVERACGPVQIVDIHRLAAPHTLGEVVRLVRFIRRERIDLVHTWDADAAIFGALAARLAGRPLITSRRDLGEIYPGWKQRLLARADRRAVAVVANAEAIKRRFIAPDLPAERIEVIPNIFDLADFRALATRPFSRSDALPPGRRIVAVARLDPEKDTGLLLRAFVPVAAACEDVSLVIAGDGIERTRLEQESRALGLGARVTFLGDVREVPALLACCDLAVLTPRANEGLSNSILEYRAAGLPVIATDCGGNAELIESGRTGSIIPVGDATALTAALFQWLERIDAPGSNAWKRDTAWVDRHTPERVAARFAALYRHGLGG
jgi:glycosyltransferase involved in cell wall biosynthesis